jgi:hypothetical protein
MTEPIEPRNASSAPKRRVPAWFWFALALGLIARLYLAAETPGTTDVRIWTAHASNVAADGLVESYARDPMLNHPPSAAWTMARLWQAAQASGIEFRTLYRALVALADVLAALLLVRVLRGVSWRWFAGALHLLSPLAIVLSGHHGNLDPLLPVLTLGGALAASSGRAVLTGMLIGLGAWVKLPAGRRRDGGALVRALLRPRQQRRDAVLRLVSGAVAVPRARVRRPVARVDRRFRLRALRADLCRPVVAHALGLRRVRRLDSVAGRRARRREHVVPRRGSRRARDRRPERAANSPGGAESVSVRPTAYEAAIVR